MKLLRRFKQTTLPAWIGLLPLGLFLGLCSGLFLGFKSAAQADIAVPVAQVIQQIGTTTQVPVLLPNQLPVDLTIYPVTHADTTSYQVDFYFAPDCLATACFYGGISAEQGGHYSELPFSESDWPDQVGNALEIVELADGTAARFINTCGAYCMANLEWLSQDILYRITVKNGQLTDLIGIANSAIAAGDRI